MVLHINLVSMVHMLVMVMQLQMGILQEWAARVAVVMVLMFGLTDKIGITAV